MNEERGIDFSLLRHSVFNSIQPLSIQSHWRSDWWNEGWLNESHSSCLREPFPRAVPFGSCIDWLQFHSTQFQLNSLKWVWNESIALHWAGRSFTASPRFTPDAVAFTPNKQQFIPFVFSSLRQCSLRFTLHYFHWFIITVRGCSLIITNINVLHHLL